MTSAIGEKGVRSVCPPSEAVEFSSSAMRGQTCPTSFFVHVIADPRNGYAPSPKPRSEKRRSLEYTMTIMPTRRVRCWPAVILALPWSWAAAQAPPWPIGKPSARTGMLLQDAATVQLIQNSSGDLAHQHVLQLSQWRRVDGTPAYREAVAWVERMAKSSGLEQVEVAHFPADGKAAYLGYRPRPAWNVRKAELWIAAPFQVKLTSYAELPFSLCRDSAPANVEAELVDIGSGLSDTDYHAPVAGKIVLTSSDPALVVEKAVHARGASGIVSYWTVPEWDRLNRLPGDSVDLVGWRSVPEQTFAFMISPRRALELQSLLRERRPVRLQAAIDVERVPGTLDVVSAVITGSKYPREEIVVSAHLDEIGADDNASGSAVLLEIARTLTTLVNSRQLPPPLRTIRFLWGPEYGATYAWLSRHLGDPVKRVAAVNIDQVGADLVKSGAVFNVVSTPDSNPSYLNAVMESVLDFMNAACDVSYPVNKDFHIISVTGTRNRLQGRMVPYLAGSDHEIYNQLRIPGTFLTLWPEKFYHSSGDTPAMVDPTQLHRSAFTGLAAIATVAYADDEHAGAIAGLAMAYAQRHVAEARLRATRLVLGSGSQDLTRNARTALKLIRHAYDREKAAVATAVAFARSGRSAEVAMLSGSLDRDERLADEQVRRLAASQAELSGTAAPDFAPSAAERDAAHLVVSRRPGHELTKSGFALSKPAPGLDLVRRSLEEAEGRLKAQGESDLRRMGFRDAACFYVDGRRSVMEIRDAVEAEYGVGLTIEAMEAYFRLFESAGAMTIGRQ